MTLYKLYFFFTFQLIKILVIRLQIEEEKLFANISGVLAVALSWEEKAKHILSSEAQMSDFEDLIRFVLLLLLFHDLFLYLAMLLIDDAI